MVRTLDMGGGALLAAALVYPWVFGMPWQLAIALAVAGFVGWIVSDVLTRRGWRATPAGPSR